jgi:hypothetical protein
MAMAPPSDELVKVLMTMAGLAYGEPDRLPGYLLNDPLTGGAWTPAWIAQAVDDPVTFAFIAQHQVTGDFVVAIRGTYPNPFGRAYWDDGNLDKPFGTMQPWPGAEASGAKVSKGTWSAFQNLKALSNGTLTFERKLLNLPRDAVVHVTGHSLGGTLAPVLALWLTETAQLAPANVVAFAGLTPGNGRFARLFGDGTALADRVWRYNNTLDTVGYGWDRIWQTRRFYEPAPRGGLLVALLIGLTRLALIPYGFTAIGKEVPLTGRVLTTAVDHGLIAYLLENLSQHLPGTYLQLLHAPPLPFTMEFVSLVTDDRSAPGGVRPPSGPLRLRTRYR